MIQAKHEKGQRVITFTGLPTGKDAGRSIQAEIEVRIGYTGGSNNQNALTLDGAVIPAIVEAVNGYEKALELCRLLQGRMFDAAVGRTAVQLAEEILEEVSER